MCFNSDKALSQADNYTILLITNQFPYGHGETFLETEIEFIAAKFCKVIIYAQTDLNTNTRSLPNNCFVFNNNSLKTHVKCRILRLIFLFMSMFRKVFIKEIRNGGAIYWSPIALGRCLRRLQQASMAQLLITYLLEKFQQIDLIYSYWLNAGVLGSIMAAPTKPIVSRAHGYDLYALRYKPQYIPFQRFCMENISQVYVISDDGYKYLTTMYPKCTHKIKKAYLGVIEKGMSNRSSDGVFRLVSCSNLISAKRVDIIAKAVRCLPFRTEWVHFGDGVEMAHIYDISKQCPNNNIHITLKGHVDNKEVLEYYKTHPVDLFITTSKYEGLPVSIMEAASCGIPVMATSVGGIPEIVIMNSTGVLLPADISVSDLIQEIEKFYHDKKFQELCSKNIYKIFQDKFNAERNYRVFVSNLISLINHK